jgi:dodecin
MSLIKVIEVISEGSSIEGAVENALAQAKKTVHGIKSIYVKDINAMVDDNKVMNYRLIVRISFLVD